MYRESDLAYLAGIMDGEGTFYCPSPKNGRGVRYKQPRMCFVQSAQNNGLELCQWAKDRFTGNISKQPMPNGTVMYRWQLAGEKAVMLAKHVEGYLIVKKDQVKRVLH